MEKTKNKFMSVVVILLFMISLSSNVYSQDSQMMVSHARIPNYLISEPTGNPIDVRGGSISSNRVAVVEGGNIRLMSAHDPIGLMSSHGSSSGSGVPTPSPEPTPSPSQDTSDDNGNEIIKIKGTYYEVAEGYDIRFTDDVKDTEIQAFIEEGIIKTVSSDEAKEKCWADVYSCGSLGLDELGNPIETNAETSTPDYSSQSQYYTRTGKDSNDRRVILVNGQWVYKDDGTYCSDCLNGVKDEKEATGTNYVIKSSDPSKPSFSYTKTGTDTVGETVYYDDVAGVWKKADGTSIPSGIKINNQKEVSSNIPGPYNPSNPSFKPGDYTDGNDNYRVDKEGNVLKLVNGKWVSTDEYTANQINNPSHFSSTPPTGPGTKPYYSFEDGGSTSYYIVSDDGKEVLEWDGTKLVKSDDFTNVEEFNRFKEDFTLENAPYLLPTDWASAVQQGIQVAQTWGSLGAALGWGDYNDPWLESLSDLGDYLSIDEWSKQLCEYPFDMNSPVNILMDSDSGGTAIMMEANKVEYSQLMECAGSDGEDNQTICADTFPRQTNIICSEGICSYKDDPYGQNMPEFYYKLYEVELIMAGSELWDDDDDSSIIFEMALMTGAEKDTYNLQGGIADDYKITVNKSSGLYLTGSNSLKIFTTDPKINYEYVCLIFQQKSEKLDEMLEEYDLDTSKFCTSFEENREDDPQALNGPAGTQATGGGASQGEYTCADFNLVWKANDMCLTSVVIPKEYDDCSVTINDEASFQKQIDEQGRPFYRFSKHPSAYPDNSKVKVICSDKTYTINIPETSERCAGYGKSWKCSKDPNFCMDHSCGD